MSLQLGPVSLHLYGLVLAAAISAGYLTARLRLETSARQAQARRKKPSPALISKTDLDSLLFWLVIPGIIGARLYHVADQWSYYFAHPVEIFFLWQGGLGVFGAIAGGTLGLYLWLRFKNKKKLRTSHLLDFAMPSLALGQAIGRFGNFVNKEAFGPPCPNQSFAGAAGGQLPFCVFIPPENRPSFWAEFTHFHPTFFYESLWTFSGFLLLLWLEKAKSRHKFHLEGGTLTAFYAVWYGSGRFFLEFLRFDTWTVGGIKIAQVISFFLIVGGLWFFRKTFRH